MSHGLKLFKINNSELTRCQMFQKNVKKLRKIDKKKLATKPSDEKTDVTYHCPIVGCRKTFDRLKRLCHHVEKRHS